MAVAYVGLPALWAETPRPSRYQSALSHCQHAPALWAAETPDGCLLAQRLCGRALCPAPNARGVGCLGGRTQGCAEHVLLPADTGGVCGIRAGEVESRESRGESQVGRFCSRLSTFDSRLLPPLLSSLALVLRLGPDEQADAGDGAVCPAVAGFLAAAAFPALILVAAGDGESALLCTVRSIVCDYVDCAAKRRRSGRARGGVGSVTGRAAHQHANLVCLVPGEADLADGPGGDLSVRENLAHRAGAACHGLVAGLDGRGAVARVAAGISGGGLVVVPWELWCR